MSARKILVIGGTGMVGAKISRHLTDRGDLVTIGSRSGPADSDPDLIEGLPRLTGDYTEGGFTVADLEDFDAVVMSAGQDIRHVKEDAETPEFWDRVQGVGVPALAQRAKDAGVPTFVQIGSYYHHLLPELAETIPYVRARRDADEGARALAGEGFAPITLNPPSIVGVVTPRARRGFEKLAAWLRGETDGDSWAPPGGTNYMSAESVAQAVAGAIDRGEAGRAYLIGDESLSFQEYFQRIVDITGGRNTLEVRDVAHPMLPDRFITQGRGNTIAYEPDPAETELLGYDRGDVLRAVTAIFADTE